VALVLVLGPLLAWSLLHPTRGQRPSAKTWLAFAAVVLAVNLPWYVLVALRQPGFLKYFFWQHNIERFPDTF